MIMGTYKHKNAKDVLDRYQRRYGDYGLKTEVFYPGKPSVKLDVEAKNWRNQSKHIYDYKYEKTGLSDDRAKDIQVSVREKVKKTLPVSEISKRTMKRK